MNCQEARDLMEWTIGRGGPAALTREQMEAVHQHASKCPACLEFVDRKVAEEDAKMRSNH